MSYGNPNRHEDNERLSRPVLTRAKVVDEFVSALERAEQLVLELAAERDNLRAQNAELLAALRACMDSFDERLIAARALLARIYSENDTP